MKLAYLIIAHKNFRQLERLVLKLAHGDVDFYLHFDKKCTDSEIARLAENLCGQANITLVPVRTDVQWGGFSVVKATVDGLKTILQGGIEYSHVVLLSGQDYPMKPNSVLIDFFARNRGTEFMHHNELSPTGWAAAMKRYQHFWLLDVIRKRYLRFFIQVLIVYLLPKRKMPYGYTAYAGSAWWALTLDCVRYIIDFAEKRPEFDTFFKFTLCPDELYFQTIVLNSPFRDKVVNNDCRYIHWGANAKSPSVLTVADYDAMVSSDKLFARKFDTGIDSTILDMLDDHMQRLASSESPQGKECPEG